MFLFADDTKCALPTASHIDSQHLQHDLDSLSSWSIKWNLPFNESKIKLLQFSANATGNEYHYSINGHDITPSTSHKDLGILFTNSLSWESHYSQIISRAYGQLSLLRRTFTLSNISARNKLYLSLVRSQMSYCSPVWRPNQIKHIVLLERVQRRATKFILSNNTLDYKSRLMHIHLLPLMFWYELADIMLLVKCLKNPQSRLNLTQHIVFSSTNTRSATFLKLTSCTRLRRTNLSRHFYFNRVCRLWNALPPIDLSLSLHTLKAKINQYLWSVFTDKFVTSIPCTYHFVCPCAKCTSSPLPTNFNTCL